MTSALFEFDNGSRVYIASESCVDRMWSLAVIVRVQDWSLQISPVISLPHVLGCNDIVSTYRIDTTGGKRKVIAFEVRLFSGNRRCSTQARDIINVRVFTCTEQYTELCVHGDE